MDADGPKKETCLAKAVSKRWKVIATGLFLTGIYQAPARIRLSHPMLRFSALTALPQNPRHLTYSLVHFFFPNILCSESISDFIPSELFVPNASGILDQIFIAP
jgi:hypothetical protein